MSTNNNMENNWAGFGGKVLYLMVGGGIGAAIALLFAPKPGRELRRDIAEVAVKGRDETLDAANRVKERSLEYLETVKVKGADMLDVVSETVSEIRDEIVDGAEKMSAIAGRAEERVTESVRPRQIF